MAQNDNDRDATHGLQQQISFSSVDYTIAEQDHDTCQVFDIEILLLV